MSFVRERDRKIVSMHANGMTSEEIETQLRTIYDIEMSTIQINNIIERNKIKKILVYKN